VAGDGAEACMVVHSACGFCHEPGRVKYPCFRFPLPGDLRRIFEASHQLKLKMAVDSPKKHRSASPSLDRKKRRQSNDGSGSCGVTRESLLRELLSLKKERKEAEYRLKALDREVAGVRQNQSRASHANRNRADRFDAQESIQCQ
jgi:hypothetical protein